MALSRIQAVTVAVKYKDKGKGLRNRVDEVLKEVTYGRR